MTRYAETMLCLVAAFGLAAGASADTIYKVRLKDGSIAFTDQPPADATILEKRQFDNPPPPPARKPPSPAPAAPVVPAATTAAQGNEAARKESSSQDIADARRELAEARERLEKGRDPVDGDFIGTANSKIKRHSPAYDERVRALEQAVADAESRLEKLEGRNAGR
jgi:hypothetical protein